MGMAVLNPFSLFMQVVLMLCLGSGSPHVAGFMQGGNETDRGALLAFKSEVTSDPFGALASWNDSIHFCQWFGVTCGRRHRRVTVLRLDGQELSGSISPHVGNLSFLNVLMLGNNSLSGKIPSELGNLLRLQQMSLTNNSITGEIPANISSCSNLVALNFSGNRLTGEIPAQLGSLTKLKVLSIGQNILAGGFPSTLGNISSLRFFYATDNKIDGNIPDTLGRWEKLELLAVAMNNLVGTIPVSIYNLSSITAFDVQDNEIEGSLPSDLGSTLPNLQFLYLAVNLFAGSIPITISNATQLEYLILSDNEFKGKVASLEKLHDLRGLMVHFNRLGSGQVDDLSFLDTLTNATRLSIVTLDYNNFGGGVPESISNFSSEFSHFNLRMNKLVGRIPSGIGNLNNMQLLGMSDNHLSGNIPSDIGKLQKLEYLYLGGNKFHGEIPSSFANLTFLRYFDVSDNHLRGNIPSYIGKFDLRYIRLEHNYLSGIIPEEVGGLSSLTYLYLASNNLTGSLPQGIGQLKNLEALDVSENMLVGNIPSSLGSCVNLSSLNMKGNKLLGILPSTLANLRDIVEIDLSHNNLSGKIPDYLEGFVFLEDLNLSFNDFEGAVPERGIFKNATSISLQGNKKLCGGIPELQLHTCNSEGSTNKGFTLAKKLITAISLALLGLLLFLCFLYLCCFKKTINVPPVKFLGNSFLHLSYQNLLKATDGFSPTNLIGVGRFSSVYKGILDEGQKVVAVKVLNLQLRGASTSFLAECKALKSINHRNLLKVLTACSSIDHQGNDFKALVYEFMINGSLEEWLHPNEIKEDAYKEPPRHLNILQRLNIAIDVASAIDYLHHHCSNQILHCDIKPSNILLDDEMIGHVGDFGLTKFLREATYSSSTNPSSSSGIRGSDGYVAPEYRLANDVSTRGDVYSYGILLLEMFTGKRPTDGMFTDSLTLHHFVKMSLPEKIADIVDPTLFQQREMGEASSSINNNHSQSSCNYYKIQECLISLLKVGIACSEELPTDRQDINDIVPQLHAIRNTLLETRVY